jgi:hypothetical protein
MEQQSTVLELSTTTPNRRKQEHMRLYERQPTDQPEKISHVLSIENMEKRKLYRLQKGKS